VLLLPSRWPLIAIIGAQAAVVLSRILWPKWVLRLLADHSPTGTVQIFFETLSAARGPDQTR
jgi:hypothetical protein